VSSTTTKKYQTNADSFEVDTPDYEENTDHSLGYNVGVGVDFDVYKNFRVGLGYRFSWLGKLGLGDPSFDDTAVPEADKLKEDDLFSQEIILQFTLLL